MAAALFLALAVLPSALTMPAANPSTTLARLVRQKVTACGGQFVADGAVALGSGTYFSSDASYATNAATQMAQFKQAGVTTIVWPGGTDIEYSHAAAATSFRPEWVLAGDRYMESVNTGQRQEQSVWDGHVVEVSNVTLNAASTSSPCHQAYQEGSPGTPEADLASYQCTAFYPVVRQFFTALQVAGPRLNPSLIDAGFHAIPEIASSDPHVPACFYPRDDYSCVKDNAAMWWDSRGQDPTGPSPGCWRMVEGGRRYLAGSWPHGEVTTQWSATDPCSGFRTFIT
jgi:hypothetical protein